jgi:hypothetical protein
MRTTGDRFTDVCAIGQFQQWRRAGGILAEKLRSAIFAADDVDALKVEFDALFGGEHPHNPRVGPDRIVENQSSRPPNGGVAAPCRQVSHGDARDDSRFITGREIVVDAAMGFRSAGNK